MSEQSKYTLGCEILSEMLEISRLLATVLLVTSTSFTQPLREDLALQSIKRLDGKLPLARKSSSD